MHEENIRLCRATLRLFKSLPISTSKKKKLNDKLLTRTLEHGFLLSPEVVYNYNDEIDNVVGVISNEFGIDSKSLNQTFHKSWKKVKDASIEQLVLEQLVHYITTYGFESVGIFTNESVYIPSEKLDIPKIDIDKFNFVVINGISKENLRESILDLINSGVALSDDTIKDVLEIIKFTGISEQEVSVVKNREVKVALFDYLGIVPEDSLEFLRYVVYKITGKSLLIKDDKTIGEIKKNVNGDTYKLFKKYQKQHGLEKLSETFYRFKPLFLAFRENGDMKPIINRMRKLAQNNHKPLPSNYLNSITSMIKNDEEIDLQELRVELSKVTVFRKIRLAYALNFRIKDSESILYRIRNGKGFATSFEFGNRHVNLTKKILKIVLESIRDDISKNVNGKRIYIPNNIHYTLPATEKQFTDNLPSGSWVSVPKDIIFGIHWEDVNNNRIDLDLSIISTEKMGWDGLYRRGDGDILFSGDITSAPKPNGATELFYVKRQSDGCFIVFVNYYNYYQNDVDVPFKIVVAKEQVSNLSKNYTINPNNIVQSVNSSIKESQKIIGLLITTSKECRFYFAESYVGNSITSSNKEFVKHSKQYLANYYKNTITLKEILEMAGAILVEDRESCDIDLSPEKLQKNTILNLLI